MRRAIAMSLLLSIALLASGNLLPAKPSCCCAMKGGGSCPLRKACTSSRTACSLGSSDASTATSIEAQPLLAIVETPFHLDAHADVRGDVADIAIASPLRAREPGVPPPRRV